MTGRLGVFGGTFDPIHQGHLDAASAARTALSLDRVVFLPAKDPPHRSLVPHANALHRFTLVALAINGIPGYLTSEAELLREGRSYTADTLRVLHAEGWTPWQLFFIIGADAFAEIAAWREFPRVLDLANFAVIARPGTPLSASLARTPELRDRVREASDVRADSTGIYVVEATTRDVSSTLVRERLATGRPLDDLVPTAVAAHIKAHHLYQTDDNLHG